MTAGEAPRNTSKENVGTYLQVEFLEGGGIRITQYPNVRRSFDLTTALKSLDDEIDRAVERRVDRHGFINYRSASGFGMDWSRIVAKAVDPLLDREEWDMAVALVLQGLKSTWGVEMDDSDGIISDMYYDVHGYFDYVLEHAGEDYEEHLIKAICDYLCDPPTRELHWDMYELQVDDLEQYLFKHFGSDTRHAGQIAQFARTRLDQKKAEYTALLAKEDKKRSWKLERAEGSIGTWMMRLLHAHKLQGATIQEVVEVAGDDATNVRVCLMLQAEARAQGDTQLARELLERTKQRCLAEGHPYPLSISERLTELLGEDEVEALREELLYQMNYQERYRTDSRVPALWPRLRATYEENEWLHVRDASAARLTGTWAQLETLESDGRYDELMDEVERRGIDGLRHFEATLSKLYPERMLRAYLASRIVSSSATTEGLWKQVKATCPDEAWPELARELICLMPDADKRMERFAKEEMFDDLMSEVEKAGITALPNWRKLLTTHYPDRVTSMLANDLLARSSTMSTTRKAYLEFCNRVLDLRKLPGGGEAAERIVAETKRRYPNRKALHEELQHAGL